MSKATKAVAVFAITAALVGLAVLYVLGFLRSRPAAISVPTSDGGRVANLTLQTVGVIGFGSHPDWVSYLVMNQRGHWMHSTVWNLPANALIHVTIYQFDTASGLRNPFWGKPEGIVGGVMNVDGQPLTVLRPPDLASHTFAIPQLGVSVPLKGVADDAPNQCPAAPCGMSFAHNTITFSFHTGAAGTYRWQCMVPCAFGFLYGFGGPMQTIGYMDGLLHVS
jgi:hypothetical protein